MIDFFDRFSYLIALAVILLSIIFLTAYKKINIIKNNKQIILYSLGSAQLLINISFYSYGFYVGGYHHLLATDLCPFLSLTSVPIFFMKKEILFKVLMPWLILGAGLTMSVASPDFAREGIFFGIVSYFKHITMMIQGIFLLIIIGRYTKKDLVYTFGFIVIFAFWILIGGLIPWVITGEEKWAVYSTALLKPSIHKATIIYNGRIENTEDYAFLGDLGPYPYMSILFYMLSLALVGLIIASKNNGNYLWNRILKLYKINQEKNTKIS